jgi:chromosome segregation protein
MASMLDNVFAVDNLQDALAMRSRLQANESVITADGIWIGPQWLRVARDANEKAGVIERENEIKQLRSQEEELASMVEQKQLSLDEGRALVQTLEENRENLQQEVNQAHRQHAQAQSQLNAIRSRAQQIRNRHENLQREANELNEQLDKDGVALKESRSRLNESLESIESLGKVREELVGKRDELRQVLDEIRMRARQDRDEMHRINMQSQSMSNQLTSTQQNLERMQKQMETLQKSREDIQESLSGSETPLKEMEERLASLLEDRVKVEVELTEARSKLEEIDEAMRQHEQDRIAAEQNVQDVRSSLEQARMGWQEFNIRAKTLQEQLAQTGFEFKTLLEELPEEAAIDTWKESVEKMERRIQRLGPINLAAIEEFAEQTERKKYLDEQFTDVTEALETLENAIRKIDKETRTRFKETFDRVNNGLKEKFPRVFGGGHAYLELTGEDLLDAGVSVMARPPGKRNSSIHLLSGGEKALTAVALVFAIFELNPAPFCMLDEVDAPLDDANVGRFCELVKEMSEAVQFIFITHNKVTMAMANQLAGVTMHEPGVSRMVAVDVDEAVKLAAM